METYRTKAYAKINLGLDVTGRLPNGYHQVRMIMQQIGIYDELVFERAGGDIVITTDNKTLPLDEKNLIYKAAGHMMKTYGICKGLRVHLNKKIPIAAGLAGGSTDAAATIKAMNHLFELNLPLSRLMEEGAAIGADVPYCILGGTALAEGIGEKLTPLPSLPACLVLVAKPEASVSTPYVYTRLDAMAIPHHPDIDGMADSIKAGNLGGILERMENVLEIVTIRDHPVIAALKERMLRLGAAGSLMSGSGPTVFGIFEKEDTAQKAYRIMKEEACAKELFLTEAH
ncbi:MAG: 4-(cytidine 5'-diphospho)-2-C-methyl-D-erythritol kinase [Lachnospiraceae bacterium]|jgi:4-diphosphocytidyl-2-C-methyl-D-erythritol kinase|nr:4-(cytidine 5'-diphospho)-2-C-methyl-D-erythritol kinase [Lachnospiraceae bacterium]